MKRERRAVTIAYTECTAVATPRIAFTRRLAIVWCRAAAAVPVSMQLNVSRREPRSTRDGLPHLFGEVECLEHLGRPEPDDELAGHAVAAAVLFGPVGAHVATARAGRDVEKILGVFTDRGD